MRVTGLLRRFFGFAFLLAGPALVCAWLVGLWFRDSDYALIWFYFIPAPVVVAFVIPWCWLTRKSGARWLRRLTLLLVAIPAAKMAVADMRWRLPAEPPAGALRVTHWNVARLPFGTNRVVAALREDAPDLCLLSETRSNIAVATFGAPMGLTNGYYSSTMTLLSRYPIRPEAHLQLPDARGWCARIATPHGPLDLLAIDLISKPQLRRDRPLAAAAAWIAAHDPRVPLLVLGDFNTPRDANAFAPFRRLLSHAYEEEGGGWPYSWPAPLAVYEIDHAWYTAESLRVGGYRLRTSLASDHCRQTFWIQFRDDSQ